MTMTSEEFCRCLLELKRFSDSVCDNWQVHQSNGCTYATKREMKYCDSELLHFEYHVTFSPSYSVPVLCFRVFRTNGSLLQLEDCWRCCGFAGNETNYSTLSQMDHSVLSQPYITLHPCKTTDVMQICKGTSKNLLVSWLSTVGPSVLLNLLPEYARLT